MYVNTDLNASNFGKCCVKFSIPDNNNNNLVSHIYIQPTELWLRNKHLNTFTLISPLHLICVRLQR